MQLWNIVHQLYLSPHFVTFSLGLLLLSFFILHIAHGYWQIKHQRRFTFFYRSQLIIVGLFFLVFYLICFPQPIMTKPSLPLFNRLLMTDNTPLTIQFHRPFSADIQATITPDIPGTWDISSPVLGILPPYQLTFTPHHSLLPDTEYSIQIKNIKTKYLPRADHDLLFNFTTATLPQLVSTMPTVDQQNFSTTQPIILEFDHFDHRTIDLQIKLQPEIELQLLPTNNLKQQLIQPQQPLQPSTDYTLTITQTPVIYDFQNKVPLKSPGEPTTTTINFRTADSPSVQQIFPTAKLLPTDSLQVEFHQAMHTDSISQHLSLNPTQEINLVWESPTLLKIEPQQPWQLNTEYRLTISDQFQSAENMKLKEAINHTFHIVGNPAFATTTPEPNQYNIDPKLPLKLTFDQPIEPSSIEGKLTLTPHTPFQTSWENDRTVVITPEQALNKQTTYKLSLSPGIKSTIGTETNQPLELQFTTISDTFKNAIPLYKQHHTFTCYAAATQMVLAYRGAPVPSELDLLNQIGYQSVERNFVTNTWGDPNQGVVGTHNGSGPGGYGAHWEPVAKAISKYRHTEIKRNWNISEMLKVVEQGNPVMVWWVNGVWPAKDVSWKTPDGNTVYTVNGMHVEVVTGWIGDRDNPQYILTNDPWRGYRKYTPQRFNSLWGWFSNTAVIVY